MLSGQICAADTINIRTYEKTEIESADIYLGKIADVSGNDRALVEKIEKISIGSAPLPGKTKRIDRDRILICLKKNGIAPSHINIIIPEDAVVIRSTSEISSEDIEKIVFDFIDKTLPYERNKVKINYIRVNNKIILPKGDITYKIVRPRKSELLGTTLLSVDFSVNGRFVKKAWVSVNIAVFTEVVVTKRPLGRYRLITEDDIHLVSMNLAELSSSVITSREEVVGKRTRRAIDSDVVLRPDLVELPPLVKRGDIVLIIAESDGLKITALGKIKEKGRKGDMVKVENVDSNKRIYARVLDSSSVKVDF
jgi:flagella basal body P-ring formation protein FlgA